MRETRRLTVRKPVTLADFQALNNAIYSEANKRYSNDHLVGRLLEEICGMMEVVRKHNIQEIPSRTARIFSWWTAVGNRFKIDLHEALWIKYPGVCPYCIRNKNCFCGVEHPDIPDKDRLLHKLRMEREREPRTLIDHQTLHDDLYGAQNKRIFEIQIAAHLAEEAGEVNLEARHNNRSGLCDEMADVGSWMFALANRCKFVLAETVWNQYPYQCERCGQAVCIDKGSRVSDFE